MNVKSTFLFENVPEVHRTTHIALLPEDSLLQTGCIQGVVRHVTHLIADWTERIKQTV